MLMCPMADDIKNVYQVTVYTDPETGRLTHEFWETQAGKSYSPHGPASRHWDKDTGGIVREDWRDSQGKLHRGGDKPARVVINPYTKVIEREEYFIHGKAHRLLKGAPSRIDRDPQSGKVVFEEWKQQGEYFRGWGNPSVVFRSEENGAIIREEYWKKDECHEIIERDPITGQEDCEEEENPKAVKVRNHPSLGM